MHKLWWYLNDTTVHLPTSLPSINNEIWVVYYTPEYNNIWDKDNFADNFIQICGASSEPLSSLILFYVSDRAKFDPGGGGGHAAPVSMSALCLSKAQRTPLHKR